MDLVLIHCDSLRLKMPLFLKYFIKGKKDRWFNLKEKGEGEEKIRTWSILPHDVFSHVFSPISSPCGGTPQSLLNLTQPMLSKKILKTNT